MEDVIEGILFDQSKQNWKYIALAIFKPLMNAD